METRLETPRLLLRPFLPRDAADCFAFLSDRETCYLDGGYEPFSEMDGEYDLLMQKFSGQEGRYMIVLKEEDRVIGTLHIFPDERRAVKAMELGYVISPFYRRRGYAREAASAVIGALFRSGVQLITAGAAAPNLPSQALLRKLGFTHEGRLHQGFSIPGVGVVDLESFYLERK